jgi:MoxR-like ATPase
MPEADKEAYRKIHNRLDQILSATLTAYPGASLLDKTLTPGFTLASGVRLNRPKDLWCALFPKSAETMMPQVYLIVSHRGVEVGYAAAIHPRDFSNEQFKTKLRLFSPEIFDALPDPTSAAAQQLSAEIAQQGGWYFRKKTRLPPKKNDFDSLSDFLRYLKSTEGKGWGAGTVARYWLPRELTDDVDLAKEFLDATSLFQPLMVTAKPVASIAESSIPDPIEQTAHAEIRQGLERFMEMYPECRSRPFGTDPDLWDVLNGLRQRFETLPSVIHRPTIRVTWSVGQGNWARVPWIAFLDRRETETTQRGIYVVLLFREDMSGVYVTFNQGVTEPKELHGGTAGLQLLRENAAALREQSAELAGVGFRLDPDIDLRTEGGLGRDYEAATIAYKLYERGRVPNDDDITRDLEAVLSVYETQISRSVDEAAATADAEARPLRPAPSYPMQEALGELFLEQHELEELLALWQAKKNLLLQGPPGVGKTYTARRLAFLLMRRRDEARIRMVQFHQAYAYEDFVQGYRPSESGGFVRRDGAFFDFAKLAEADLDRPYVFIIDEINRGNLSKILGELMMLIESDKRGEDYGLPLAYGRPDEPPFSVPRNLYLLGLMNTADRSLAIVDYALRRRFAFYELGPRFASEKFRQFLQIRGADHALIEIIVSRLQELNNEIAKDTIRLGPGYQIGHSFFTPADETQVLDVGWYQRVVRYEISPLTSPYGSNGSSSKSISSKSKRCGAGFSPYRRQPQSFEGRPRLRPVLIRAISGSRSSPPLLFQLRAWSKSGSIPPSVAPAC